MADIRIRDLPTASPPVASDFIAIDNGTTRKTDIQTLVQTGRPSASQPEAEAGVESTKAMTPLTTKQAVEFYGLTKDGNLSGITNAAAARNELGLGSAAVASTSDFATAAQGALADSAVQPGDLATVATTGDYGDLINKPTLRWTQWCWNGGFDIWSRGTSFAGTAARIGTADGWTIGRSSGATGCTVSQQQGSRGTNLCARVQRDSGNTGTEQIALVFNLSIADTRPLSGKTIFASFRLRKGADFSEASSLLTCQIKTSTSLTEQAINATNGTYTTGDTTAASTTALLTTSMQDFNLTVALPSDVAQMALRFTYAPVGTAGANDWFEIEEVQIGLGSIPTAYVAPDPAYASLRAKEQFQKTYNPNVAPGTVSYLGAPRATSVGTTNGKAIAFYAELDPPMRATPTVAIYSPQTGASGQMAQGSTADIAANAGHIGVNGFAISNGATAVASDLYYFHYTAEARL